MSSILIFHDHDYFANHTHSYQIIIKINSFSLKKKQQKFWHQIWRQVFLNLDSSFFFYSYSFHLYLSINSTMSNVNIQKFNPIEEATWKCGEPYFICLFSPLFRQCSLQGVCQSPRQT